MIIHLQVAEQQYSVSIIALAAVCLIVFVLIFSRYRSKAFNDYRFDLFRTELAAKGQQIEKLQHDNEWLLREVHHRVKNNLQIVSSLLNSQATYLKDGAALDALTESQQRVQAIALIHQKLYQSGKYAGIYMPEYVSELTGYLKSSFKGKPHIFFDLHIEPIYLDVTHATPVGLILNEIMTNAYKHAFGRSGVGHIDVQLRCSAYEEVTLTVADNGNGLPRGFHAENQHSFGMMLIRGLTGDLDGIYAIENAKGTTVNVKFKNTQTADNGLPGMLPGAFKLPASCLK